MNPKLKAKWVKALRSGKYKQTRGQLLNEKTGGMCCIGVLAKVCGISRKRMLDHNFSVGGTALREIDVLDDLFSGALIKMNDSGKRFTTIADYIEKNL